jgi:phosphatidate cytidylyltransferase
MPQARRAREQSPAPRREPRQRPERRPREPEGDVKRPDLFRRVIVAVPAAVLAIGFVDLGGTGWALLMAVLGCACIYELYHMLERWRPVPLVGYLAVVGMCAAARYGGERDTFAVALGTVPVMFLAIAARPSTRGATIAITGTMLGVFWIGLAFAHAVLLEQLPHGNGIVIDVMIGTFLADTGAYFGGRLWGRRPLAPEISPKKSVEGLICGMIVAVVAVFCAHLYQTNWLSQGQALALGLAIAVLGPIGDLFVSLIKRDVGVKDAGNLFGAHGGALDRLDAISFTIVAAYYIWAAVPHL